jgi:hypothetical protein
MDKSVVVPVGNAVVPLVNDTDGGRAFVGGDRDGGECKAGQQGQTQQYGSHESLHGASLFPEKERRRGRNLRPGHSGIFSREEVCACSPGLPRGRQKDMFALLVGN